MILNFSCFSEMMNVPVSNSVNELLSLGQLSSFHTIIAFVIRAVWSDLLLN